MWSHFVQWPADCFDPPEGVDNQESGHCSCNFVQFLNDLRESLVQLFYPGTWGTVTYTVLKLISTTLLCGLRHVWFCQFLFECSIISSCCQLSEHMYLNYNSYERSNPTVFTSCYQTLYLSDSVFRLHWSITKLTLMTLAFEGTRVEAVSGLGTVTLWKVLILNVLFTT